MTEQVQEKQLEKVIEKAEKKTRGERVSVGDLLNVYKTSSYGPMLMIVSLVSLFPLIGGLPLMTMITGSIIILIAAQMPFRQHPWLPGWVRRASIPRDKMVGFTGQAKRWTTWLSKLVRPRLCLLTNPPFLHVVALAIVFLGLLFFPLDYIPFAVAAPASVVALFAIGLTIRDGVLILLALALTAVPVGLVVWLWPF